MSVTRGPWGTTPVVQTAPVPDPDQWWRRADDGRLWVWMGSWVPAPVRKAPVRGPKLPDRPPVPARITMALDMCGLYGPEVDEALGVADALDTVVDAWETGDQVPTHDDIRRLARLTGMLPSWFYQYHPAVEIDGDALFVCRRGQA